MPLALEQQLHLGRVLTGFNFASLAGLTSTQIQAATTVSGLATTVEGLALLPGTSSEALLAIARTMRLAIGATVPTNQNIVDATAISSLRTNITNENSQLPSTFTGGQLV